MKLSQETINTLKHAASINPSIMIDAGNMIFSVHESRTVRMQATVEETFPQSFALINLNQFLNIISLVDDAELTFNDDNVLITSSNGNQKMTYFFSDPAVIQQSNKQIKSDIQYDFSFNITRDDLQKLNRAAAAIMADDICVYNEGAEIYVSALDKKKQAGNTFKLLVGSDSALEGKNFKVYFRKNNLKLTNNDFTVSVSSRGVSTWKAMDSSVPELIFYIVIERDSEFN